MPYLLNFSPSKKSLSLCCCFLFLGSTFFSTIAFCASQNAAPTPTPSASPGDSQPSPTTPVTPEKSPAKLPSTAMGPIAATVGRILEQGHFLRLPLNDPKPPHDADTPEESMQRRVLRNYLQLLDYNHLYFTQVDIHEFEEKYGNTISTDLLRGDLTSAHAIYDRFRQRVEERIAKNKILAAAKHDFSSSRSVELNRQKAPWPKDDAEADQLWNDRIEAELLQEHLSKHPIDTPEKIVVHRYDQTLKALHEQTEEDILKTFLVALSESYDPHSEYMSPSDMENFNIQMRLSLVGIGAMLRTDDGYTRIVEIMPGGPADREGTLQANDRITAVAQGNGPFEDVIDLRIDKVVEKIRGKKGTKVRLKVIPANATDPSKQIVIEIIRDEVKLKESEVKAEVIDFKGPDKKSEKLGWLTIPAFYSEMDRHGAPDAKSTTKDVRLLLTRLKKENIQGLVIDLRRNGGGSLEEAINLTGLFIGPGPVVQAKDSNGNVTLSSDTEPAPFYNGPLLILTNRLSASASEIFAGALQDYNRAVIVGDQRSFGKGTVQTLLNVGKFMPLFQGSDDAGSLKLTIQKFYRVSGASTQHRGVASDIVLPSLTDNPDIGENMLPNPLIYDEVDPQPFPKLAKEALFLDKLKADSAERVKKDLEFRYITENMQRLSEKIKNNHLSLNEQLRKQELADDKKRTAQHQAERSVAKEAPLLAYELTLDTVDKPTLAKVVPKKKKTIKSTLAQKKDEDPESDLDPEDENNDDPALVDPEKREALNIVQELSTLTPQPVTASLPVASEKK